MRLPKPLLRRNNKAHKNTFGHALIIAGSARMLGAAALTSLSAMRSGVGLVTLAIPRSLNLAVQKKISNTIMTWPLDETKNGTLSLSAAKKIISSSKSYNVIAIGPGLEQNNEVKKFVYHIVSQSKIPLIIDADALNVISENTKILLKTKTPKILTPHPGEMARLTKKSRKYVEEHRKETAQNVAKTYNCTVLLKGHKTIISSPNGIIKINPTGNVGLATAGSGDVLTGMITALVAQGLPAFEAAVWGAYLHGLAGDLAAKKMTKTAMIASDIIGFIPSAFKKISL